MPGGIGGDGAGRPRGQHAPRGGGGLHRGGGGAGGARGGARECGGVALPVPQYELEDLLLEDTLVLRVSLPGITSFEQIELSASSTSVEVAAAGFSALSIELPAPVDETRSKAEVCQEDGRAGDPVASAR